MSFRRTIVPLMLGCTLGSGYAADMAGAVASVETQRGLARDVRPAPGVAPVSFQFATREEGHDIPLTGVHVAIVCPVAGIVFQGVSEGPFLIANIANGRYEVIASHAGRSRRVTLDVARGEPRRVEIYW